MLRHFFTALLVLVWRLSLVTGNNTTCPKVEDNSFVFQLKDDIVCYEFVEAVENPVSYADAEKSCSTKNGYLLTIKNNMTQTQMVMELKYKSDSHTILLGLKRHGNVWKWTTGESVTYTNWKQTTAPACDTCTCAKMLLDKEGAWEAFDCRVSDWYNVYVCEYGAAFSINTHDRQQQLLVVILAVLAVYTTSFTGSQ